MILKSQIQNKFNYIILNYYLNLYYINLNIIMDYLDEKKIDWKIINSYFNSNNYYFTISQIESYNDFV